MRTYKNVKPAQLQKWLGTGEAAIIDVREPGAFMQQHIRGFVLKISEIPCIPFFQLSLSSPEFDTPDFFIKFCSVELPDRPPLILAPDG